MRHERPRTGGGVDSPQWQWHLLPEPVVSSCGPVASLQTIHTSRVESVSGARMQAIFVMLNHQDMCHGKIRWSSLQLASRQQKSELSNRNSRSAHSIWNHIFYCGKSAGEKPLGRPKRWWQNTPMDVKGIGSEMRSAFNWLWIRNTSADDWWGGEAGTNYRIGRSRTRPRARLRSLLQLGVTHFRLSIKIFS